MKIKNYIEQCKNKAGIKTNKKLGAILEIDERKLNFYEKGERIADEESCFKIANYLNLDEGLVIAEIRAEGEKDELKKKYFSEQVKKLKNNKINLCIVIFSITALLLLPDRENDNWIIAILTAAITSIYYKTKN
jgi:transcriptional regulator with XRE-family HTH domain